MCILYNENIILIVENDCPNIKKKKKELRRDLTIH